MRLLPALAPLTVAFVGFAAAAHAQPFERTYFGPTQRYASIGGAADLDGDGTDELVISSLNTDSRGQVSILRYDSGYGYDVEWHSAPLADEVWEVYLFEASSGWRIAAPYQPGLVKVFDAVTHASLGTIAPGSVRAVRQGDADNDSLVDLVILTHEGTHLYDLDSLALRRTLPYTAEDLRLGNVDDDPLLELVYLNGRVIEQSGDQSVEQWKLGAGGAMELADIDDDDRQEILLTRTWGIRAFDGDVGTLKWSRYRNDDFNSIVAVDLQGDSTPELALDYTYNHVTTIVDAESGEQLRELPTTGEPRFLDVAHPGRRKVATYDEVLDLETGESLWEAPFYTGPLNNALVADVDGDDRKELLVAAYHSEHASTGPGLLMVYDAATLRAQWQITLPNGFLDSGISDLAVADIDADGDVEILAAAWSNYDQNARLFVLDGATRQITRTIDLADLGQPSAVAAGDVDGDGSVEIVLGTWSFDWVDQEVLVLDASTGELEWEATMPINFAHGIAVADLDADPALEIVVASSGGGLAVIDGASHIVRTTFHTDFQAFTIASGARRGRHRLIATTSDGEVHVVASSHFASTALGRACAGHVDAISPLPRRRLVISCEKELRTFDRRSGQVTWQSEPFETPPGAGNDLPAWRSRGRLHVAATTRNALHVLSEVTD